MSIWWLHTWNSNTWILLSPLIFILHYAFGLQIVFPRCEPTLMPIGWHLVYNFMSLLNTHGIFMSMLCITIRKRVKVDQYTSFYHRRARLHWFFWLLFNDKNVAVLCVLIRQRNWVSWMLRWWRLWQRRPSQAERMGSALPMPPGHTGHTGHTGERLASCSAQAVAASGSHNLPNTITFRE